jgi:16S rRNA (cytosine1402-N4)-methyltransferase
VLLNEAIEALNIDPDGVYIDCTCGRGGHSIAILGKLNKKGRLIAIDKDLEAVAAVQKRLLRDRRFSIKQYSFSNLIQLTDSLNLTGQIDGMLLDLGVSSPQLDDPQRGFSFLKQGPLDMRMDRTCNITAAQWLARVDESKLAEVIKTYGEDRYARRIAKTIIAARNQFPIKTTRQLASLICDAIPVRGRHKHPATRTFQAIRIVVNSELQDLKKVLKQSLAVINKGGRLVVISFHSLEDRIVKRFIRDHSMALQAPRGLPVIEKAETAVQLRRVGRARRASKAECQSNPRARSAILRTAEHL